MMQPDFSGTWQFNLSQSALQILAPESTIFVIEHREPHFHLERTHVFGGKSDTFSIALTTDEKAVRSHHSGFEMHVSLHWEGETLVFDSTLERAGEQATNFVRYRLPAEDQVLIAEEQFRSREHRHENRWVFDKQ